MLACIVGNIQTGLINLALINTLAMSDRSESAYKLLLWNKSYTQLRFHAAIAVQCTCKLLVLHRHFMRKYSDAHLLKPLEITFFAPVKRNCLLPLVKIHHKIALLNEDRLILATDEYLLKLSLYLKLKNHLALVSFYTKRKLFSEIGERQGQIVKSLWEREIRDVRSKLRYVVDYRHLLQFTGVVSIAVRSSKKAQQLSKVTKYISTNFKLDSQPVPSALQKILTSKSPSKIDINELMLHSTFLRQGPTSSIHRRTDQSAVGMEDRSNGETTAVRFPKVNIPRSPQKLCS
jgi:hypothetical protein